MTTYAGRAVFPAQFIDPYGNAQEGTTVTVYARGTTDLATLYADRTKATTTANPFTTDALGNAFPYVDPGEYDALVNGVTIPFSVLPDWNEPAAGLGAGAVSNVNVAADAAIAQSKVSGLTASLSAKASITDARLRNGRDDFARADGALGSTPDGTAWISTSSGAGVSTIVGEQMVAPTPGSGGSTTYNSLVVAEEPDWMSAVIEIRPGTNTTDPIFGLLSNQHTDLLLEDVVHCYVYPHGLAIGRIVGNLQAGGVVVDDYLYSYPGGAELAPGFYEIAIRRNGNTVSLIDPIDPSVTHSFTHASYGTYWGRRLTWELSRGNVLTAREPRFDSVEWGVDLQAWKVQPSEAIHIVGAAGEPAFNGDWVPAGGGYADPYFWREGSVIHLGGAMKSASSAVPGVAFVMPTSHLPVGAAVLRFPDERIDIAANGTITVQSAVAPAAIFTLEGLSYRAKN